MKSESINASVTFFIPNDTPRFVLLGIDATVVVPASDSASGLFTDGPVCCCTGSVQPHRSISSIGSMTSFPVITIYVSG